MLEGILGEDDLVRHEICEVLVGITGVDLGTFADVTMTSGIKIAVVLFLLRNALGIQQTPPNIVLYGIALLLSIYVMAPVVMSAYTAAITTPVDHMTLSDMFEAAKRAEQWI